MWVSALDTEKSGCKRRGPGELEEEGLVCMRPASGDSPGRGGGGVHLGGAHEQGPLTLRRPSGVEVEDRRS